MPRTPLALSRRAALILAAAPAALLGAGGAFAQPEGSDLQRGGPGSSPAQAAPLGFFALDQVRVTGGPLLEAQQSNLAFMKRVDPDRLLHSFRLTAGLPSSAQPLGGWEAPDCELRGHFTGHYLSATALAYASTGDPDMRQRGAHLVAALAECQRTLNAGGYLSAFPMEEFDRLDQRRPVWAPFYTLHKIMAGLLDQHVHARNAQALPVLTGMAVWVDAWTAAKPPAHMQDILDEEFGGMNEVLYNLSAVTGEDRWMQVGDRFIKARFMTPLAERRDELRGLHMNTHVPQVIGAARRFELTSDPRSGHAARFFWETVTESRAYATGGSSNREHWLSAPYQLGDEWGQDANHQECCCAYNMMKLTRKLHQLAPQVRYMDFYERNLINHRLGTIQPGTGRTTYFLSLAPGAWKTVASDDQSFWCCTGTGIEEFSKLGDTLYAHDGRGVYVNLFAPSELHWAERGLRLRQETDFPATPRTTLVVVDTPPDSWPLRLRIPSWTTTEARVRVNGALLETSAEPGGYFKIERRWRPGDRVELELPMPLTTEAFPDRPATQAFLVGPVVLAGQLSDQGLSQDLVVNQQGPQVERAKLVVKPIRAHGQAAAALLQAVPGQPLTYTLAGQDRPILLKPLNESWARHVVYWDLV
jgi:DUF1680 family protein